MKRRYRRLAKRFLGITLSVLTVSSALPVAAFAGVDEYDGGIAVIAADGEHTVADRTGEDYKWVSVDSDSEGQSDVVTGDVSGEDDRQPSVMVDSDGAVSNVTAGDVTSSGEVSNGIYVGTHNEGISYVTTGNISASGKYSNGASVNTDFGGGSIVNTGDVSSAFGTGVYVSTGFENSNADITTGNISASGAGVNSSSYLGGSAQILSKGNVTGGTGINLSATNEGSVVVEVDGNVSGTAEAGANNEFNTSNIGLNMSGSWNGSMRAYISGDVTGTDQAVKSVIDRGTMSYAVIGGNVNGDVYSDVNVPVQGQKYESGREYDDSSLFALGVTGNVNGTLEPFTFDGGRDIIYIEGDAGNGECAVNAFAYDRGRNYIIAEGDLNGAVLAQAGLFGDSHEDNALNDITVDGNITGSSCGLMLGAFSGSHNTVITGGDVSGEDVGVMSTTMNSGYNEAVIEGTLSGRLIGVGLSVDPDEEDEKVNLNDKNFTLSVWKIETDDDGYVAGDYTYDETGTVTGIEQDEAFEKTIRYIIKLDQPRAGATLSAADENGNPLGKVQGIGNDYDWAYEGDTVLLKIDLQDGYMITGAFGDEGRSVSLLQDTDGNYYAVVPKGGGVMLSVTLAKITPEPQPVPVIEPDGDNTENEEGSDNEAAAAMPVMAYSEAVMIIMNAEAGNNVTLPVSFEAGISREVLDAISARGDVSFTFTYSLGGVLYSIVIPAGFNIELLRNAAGGADILTLIALFGAVPMI